MSKFLTLMLAVITFAACTNTNEKMKNCVNDTWDKVFPLSEKVNHKKVSFETQYGFTLVGDLYWSNDQINDQRVNCQMVNGKRPALAVSGPFGATKEQSSGLYAMKMAERGFIALAFDPSFTGESSGEPRRTASPDINTEDFMAAVDYLSKLPEVDAERIGIIGICGWGGIALNAAAADTRIKATVASTMYDMTRVSGNGYFDSADTEEARHEARVALAAQRLADPAAMAGGVIDPLPDDA
ncbi:MAG: alpha/beta hydrolase, partial [Paludibacteraceae bacterium]|nr:alpha/beta hydrolase [Paludibacteraceae bacterium]